MPAQLQEVFPLHDLHGVKGACFAGPDTAIVRIPGKQGAGRLTGGRRQQTGLLKRGKPAAGFHRGPAGGVARKQSGFSPHVAGPPQVIHNRAGAGGFVQRAGHRRPGKRGPPQRRTLDGARQRRQPERCQAEQRRARNRRAPARKTGLFYTVSGAGHTTTSCGAGRGSAPASVSETVVPTPGSL